MKPHNIAETITPQGLIWRFNVPSASPFFQGHFPSTPILPGVVALAWMLQAAERFLGNPLPPPTRLQNIKFQLILKPGDVIELQVIPQGDKNQRLQTRIISKAGVHASVIVDSHP